MNKKGFTLIELLAVVAILVIVIGLVSPTLIKVLKNNKQKAVDKTVEIIESAARSYVLDYGVPPINMVCVSELCDKEYLTCPIKNAVDNSDMNGCVIIDTNKNYTYENSLGGGVQLAINLDGGSVSTNQFGLYLPGQNITLTEPTKEGCEFSHWSIESGNSVLSGNTLTMGTEDTNLKAIFIIVDYVLTFNANGGSVNPGTKEITYQEAYGELPIPTREAYSFIGWYTELTGGNKVTSSTNVSVLSDHTVYAHWVKTITEYTYIEPTTENPNSYYEFAVLEDGKYKIELWGAGFLTGYGAYTRGNINLIKGDILYVYIGGSGVKRDSTGKGGYNGGGDTLATSGKNGPTGSGATDVRFFTNQPTANDLLYNSELGLKSRIMVAAGGGGEISAGGLEGYEGYESSHSNYPYVGKKGTQISGGAAPTKWSRAASNGTAGGFGYGGVGGASAVGEVETGGGGGGGAGYFGGSGASGLSNGGWDGASGSSYISGHTGCVAMQEGTTTPKTGCTTGTTDNLCSVHYSNKVFTDTLMIDGAGYTWTNVKAATVGTNLMPNPGGGTYASGVGHSGNGYARITYMGP